MKHLKQLRQVHYMDLRSLLKNYSKFFKTNLKYIINRFGVIAGPWQFGKQSRIYSLWVQTFLKKLSYIGFGGLDIN